MRRLGWLIVTGSAVAAVIQQLALDCLLNSLLTGPESLTAADTAVGVVQTVIRGMLPVSAVARTALLTFARIIRLDADIDDELQATV